MCVIAGYIGSKPAAPVLLDMLKRQEGLAGGFYSGIVTVHEGKLHHAKVVGDADTLIRETQAMSLPGTIGLAHGRTPSGGGQAWAHPFLDKTQQLAYIANGSRGRFRDCPELDAMAGQLFAAGQVFTSRQDEAVGSYPKLPTGESVHMSDVMCQAIAQSLLELEDADDPLLAAAIRSYEDLPGEIVGMCIHASRPDEIIAVRINKPMAIARNAQGDTFIASSPAGFPEAVRWRMNMPACTGGVLRRDGTFTLQPMSRLTATVAQRPLHDTMEQVVAQQLDQGEADVHQLMKAAALCWPTEQLNQREVLVYEILTEWEAQGWIVSESRQVPGMFGQGTVPRCWFRWGTSKQRPAAAGTVSAM